MVSIHAPTGGATFKALQKDGQEQVSIHAPTGGATFAIGLILNYKLCFNSRAHRGRDPSGTI